MSITKNFFAVIMVFLASATWAEEKTVVLQQGLDGYNGCIDAELRNPNKGVVGNGPQEEILAISGF